jgi:hypothetical protein
MEKAAGNGNVHTATTVLKVESSFDTNGQDLSKCTLCQTLIDPSLTYLESVPPLLNYPSYLVRRQPLKRKTDPLDSGGTRVVGASCLLVHHHHIGEAMEVVHGGTWEVVVTTHAEGGGVVVVGLAVKIEDLHHHIQAIRVEVGCLIRIHRNCC